ncbi:MAG TPA: biotin--[acetyl-CoA-carboxylase] ligase [Sedimentisphaerales bacterium]|nr:biotin--[acetyl-CoA-carboxylase] ligase [Sedimentisphaerales bacterium]
MACPKTDQLDPDKIKGNLKTNRIGKKVLVYNRTSSTNDIAAEYAKNKKNDGLVVFAEEQTAGRGRAGAKWHSEPADSILCSIVLTDCKLNPELLSLTCAVAVADGLGKIGGTEAKIKWPNDIILNGEKIAGIMLESTPRFRGGDNIISAKAGIGNDGNTYIIGIGINCHQSKDSFPEELQPIATSIDIESHATVDRISLSKRLLISVDHWLEVAEQNSKKVTDQWRKLSIQLNHRVKLIYNGREFAGNCIGIDPEKGLILQLDTGGVRMFDAAHTTITKQK